MRFQVVTPRGVQVFSSWEEAVQQAREISEYDLESEFAYVQHLDSDDNIIQEVFFFRGQRLVKANDNSRGLAILSRSW